MASPQSPHAGRSGRSVLLFVFALLLVTAPLGAAGARRIFQVGVDSPAVDGAQVTTQGLVDLPEGQIAYRLVRRTAPARGNAKVGRRVLSIVLASDEPVLLSNERADGTIEDIARVSPGEAYLVKDGTRQIRSSLTDQPVEYLAIEIVPARNAGRVTNAELLWVSDPFTAPDGLRDLDFIRNVLDRGDSGFIPDSGSEVVILATDGAIDILPENGPARTLQAGESATFPAGDIEVRPATPTANSLTGSKVAGLTSALQTSGSEAAYVVSVIGPKVEPTDPTPTPTPAPAPPTIVTVETPVTEPAATGTIGVSGFACPASTVEALNLAECRQVSDGFALSISNGAQALGLKDAMLIDGTWYWSELALGTYSISVDDLPKGMSDYFLPGSAAVGGSAREGYTVTLDETTPQIVVPIYFLAADPTPTATPEPVGAATIILYECAGYDPNAGPTNCQPTFAGYPNQPYLGLAGAQQTYDTSSAVIDGNVYSWLGLPPGTYYVGQTNWPYDTVINGVYYKSGQTYIFPVFPGERSVIEVYNIQPVIVG